MDDEARSNDTSFLTYYLTIISIYYHGDSFSTNFVAYAAETIKLGLLSSDTIKTRLQSQSGFRASGGFGGIFKGLLPAVIGSAPGAAAFFVTYEYFKTILSQLSPQQNYTPTNHMVAASLGEISACVVRVPTEILKQRLQAQQYSSTFEAVTSVYKSDGMLGFYRGYLSTVLREIPFTCIQFPLYEYLKHRLHQSNIHSGLPPPKSYELAILGSIAGGIAAAITTPLDVVKTRVMLSSKSSSHITNANIRNTYYHGVFSTFRIIIAEDGVRALFRGLGPRVVWISMGGFVFLGVYEKVKSMLENGGSSTVGR
ncbi:mitochondrial carrier domain-containing protein [Paraphysoderma sedebokerense]|nr:mitochondrial carrier domain-containing protein [Paraphysoderma sedebokerense]